MGKRINITAHVLYRLIKIILSPAVLKR